MAQVPSTVWSPFAVLSAVRNLANVEDAQLVVQEQGRMFYRLALSEVAGLLNKVKDPAYFSSSVLTVSADQERLTDTTNNSGIITAVNSTDKTITRSSGVFVTGSIFVAVLTPVDAVGGVIDSQWIGRFKGSGATAEYEVLSGTDASLTGAKGLALTVIKSMETLVADISNIRFDEIVAIQSSTAGFCKQVDQKTFFDIRRPDFMDTSYYDDVVWTLIGNSIYFNVGRNIKAGIGTVTMYYQRQPDYPATDALYTDTSLRVDLSDKWMPLLIKRILVWVLLQKQNDIPANLAQELQLYYQEIGVFEESEKKNKGK